MHRWRALYTHITTVRQLPVWRSTLGGGVSVLVNNKLIATEQVEVINKCEIEWVRI